MLCKSSEAVRKDHKNAPTIRKYIGEVKIVDINVRWVKAYIAQLQSSKTRVGRPFTDSTIAGHMGVMSKACRWLADHWDLPAPSLPFSTKYLSKNWDDHRSRRLSASEEVLLRTTLRNIRSPSSPHWRCLVQLALETGARLQELLLAQWSEMDLGRGLWLLPAAHTKCDEERAIPLSRRARRYLRFLQSDCSTASPRIFHRLGSPTSVSAGFHKFAIETGLVDFRFHDLRHEAISRMVIYKRKLSVFEIMRIVGHSNMKMLVRYSNLRGDELTGRMD